MPKRKISPATRAKRKFRLYYKTHHRHPAVIVEEDGSNAAGYVVTHSAKSGGRRNNRLSTNLRTGDSSEAYLARQRRKGTIGRGWSSFYLQDYSLSETDERLVDEMEKGRALQDNQRPKLMSRPSAKSIPAAKPRNKKKKRALQPLEAAKIDVAPYRDNTCGTKPKGMGRKGDR